MTPGSATPGSLEEFAARHGIDLNDLAEEMHTLLTVMTEEEAEQAIEAWRRLGWVEVVTPGTR
ncbi:MAG: hypothetical protein QNK04_05265 [Myxococcota bacterium]|nr:hypothetical protein [Myxococcota bacterium]